MDTLTATLKPKYTRPKSLVGGLMPYCPGCGHSLLHKIICELIDEMGLQEKTVGVAPVGCSVRAYDYFGVDMTEAAHGRAPAVATGIKRARPDLFVFAYQGDGDLAATGTTEIIHAANRGENYVTIFVNNTVYGMTGGQLAPTTMIGQKTSTSPGGRGGAMGGPMHMCEIINCLDAPALIVRTMLDGPGGVHKTKAMIRKGFKNELAGKGFSFIEVLSPCPTYMRLTPLKALEHVKATVAAVFPVKIFRDRSAEQEQK